MFPVLTKLQFVNYTCKISFVFTVVGRCKIQDDTVTVREVFFKVKCPEIKMYIDNFFQNLSTNDPGQLA